MNIEQQVQLLINLKGFANQNVKTAQQEIVLNDE